MTRNPETAIDRLLCDNAAFVERLLDQFVVDRRQVPRQWHEYLEQLLAGSDGSHRPRPPRRRYSIFNPASSNGGATQAAIEETTRLQRRADSLIRAYRVRGHLAAKIDPLEFGRPAPADLSLATHRLSESDLDRRVVADDAGKLETLPLREVVERLRETYCRLIGVQYMHIDEPEVRDWLLQRMESSRNRIQLTRKSQLRILTHLTEAVVFEEFVRKKYLGAKTFSLEGSESLIPLLDLAIEKAGRQGIQEIVIGMAHRGRLNVLANIIGKRPREIFWEFEDPDPHRFTGRGDVKYHKGFSGDWRTEQGDQLHLSLCFNPSHLEFVDPVAVGRVRAKQDRTGDTNRERGMALLIHGDAALAGEGVVQETLNMSGLPGYTTGGTLHVVVNNQLGFTTAPVEGRSTVYATDVAKMLQIPIFHVNGEQPEAVAQVVELAMDFRRKFRRDAVIDMYGFRRWGHNESDEPSFTQPLMYQAIEHRESVREAYLDHLLELEGISRAEGDRIEDDCRDRLQQEFEHAQDEDFQPQPSAQGHVWEDYQGGPEPDDEPDTGISADRAVRLLVKLTDRPDGFHLHKKLRRSTEHRLEMADGQRPLDWAAGEALALASLAFEGHPVRLTGQDTARGTFSQRHAVLHDVVNGNTYCALQHLGDDQAPVEIINSPLCETGALGFEYGYSLDRPDTLVAWEAQFGDFGNAAQVIIDQFIASAEDKWRRLSGLVLLLPHGFEGMGPEHSSARLERFLMLSAEDNLQIACPTSPAQYFHLLRRQIKRTWRKPLVVLTPKSLLRHPRVVSPLEDFTRGRFQRVLPDERSAAGETRRVLLCSGKVYFDLAAYRDEHEVDDVAIVRVEQFYPLADDVLRSALERYEAETPVTWVQEEPENMGARPHWKCRFGARLLEKYPLNFTARAPSASPATGSAASHKREQRMLIEQAFGDG